MKAIVFKFFALLILLGSLAAGWALLALQELKTTPISVASEGLYYEIKSGDTLKRLTQKLAHMGVLSHPNYLIWYARLNGSAHSIKQGEYLFKPGITAIELLSQIVSGNTIQYSLTIVEGWTFAELRTFLAKNDNIKNLLDGLTDQQIMAKLGHPDQHPEGRFLPDTYHFPRNTTDLAFLQRAYQDMETFLAKAWEKRRADLPLKSPYEALILASIVEKETGLASERPAIAGIFIRRLEKKMRLQTDPTVIYGIGKKFDGNLRRRDLVQDTPYNTYRRHGLPPTPIALPGREAITAALNPDDNTTLYFVAKGDGSHHFTSTLKDHNNAVIKYQLGGKARPFSSMKKVNKSK